MPARLRRLVLLLGTLAVALPAAAAPAGAPAWTRLPLAGGRQGLLPRIGMAAEIPLALVAGEVIRVLHASRDLDTPLRASVREYFGRPDQTPTETIPVPLPVKAWRDLLGRGDERTLLAAILDDRRASMLCFGLLQLDPATLEVIAADTGLLRRIYERHSGAFAAFAGAIRIEEGRLRLPGSEAAEPAWVALIGEPLAPASRALMATIAMDDGRLLYFADALVGLDPRLVDLVFTGPNADVTPADQARSVYHAFTAIESGWKLGDFPFVRLGADPALGLSRLRLDSTTGRLRHTREFWDVIFSDRRLPRDYAQRWRMLGDEVTEPGWMLERLTDAELPVRLERMLVYEFVERLTDRLPGATPADLAWLGRAYRRYPALLLSLERLGVNDVSVYTRLVSQAGRLVSVSGDQAQLETKFALFQAPLMLVTRALEARAMDRATRAGTGRGVQRDRAREDRIRAGCRVVARAVTPAGPGPRRHRRRRDSRSDAARGAIRVARAGKRNRRHGDVGSAPLPPRRGGPGAGAADRSPKPAGRQHARHCPGAGARGHDALVRRRRRAGAPRRPRR